MTPATSSPSMRALNSRDASPSPRQTPLSRMPYLQQVNTSVSQTLIITPASARSTSSITQSPYLHSIQSSPSASYMPQQHSHLASPAPLELPEPILPGSQMLQQTRESVGGNKSGGIMRKLSQTAKAGVHGVHNTGQRLRRKTSSSNHSRRDESSGPVTRRRSDSKTATANVYSTDLYASDAYSPDVTLGLGLDALSVTTAEPFSSLETRPEGVGSAVPEKLVRGCVLTKFTRNKKQDKLFFLDVEGSRMSWSGTVSMKSFHIDNIKSIRTGEEAARYCQEVKGEKPDPTCCFTINYATSERSNDVKTLHLSASTKDDLALWVDTLEALAKHREDLMTGMTGSTERESVIRAHWDSEITRRIGKSENVEQNGLDLAAIEALCRKLHIHCPKIVIVENFHVADVRKIGLLDYKQFKDFVRRLRERADIRPIFNSLKSSGEAGITREQFLDFVTDTQGVNLADPGVRRAWESKADQLIAKSSYLVESVRTTFHIDFNAFTSFLVSKDCRVYSSTDEANVCFDRPINEYFISSSHNTYLTGRQVAGHSSAEAYITALRHGCRCVEIDCWDGDDGNPRVTHGFTRTTSVPFIDCITAISRCAFDVSPYPVIVSLEVHCNSDQQKKMVSIMKDVLRGQLLLHPRPNATTKLPSPEDLKYKILIKVKAADSQTDLVAFQDLGAGGRKRSTSSPYRRPLHSTTSLVQPFPSFPAPAMMSPPDTIYSPTELSMTTTSASSAGEDSDTNAASPVAADSITKPVKYSKITPGLAELGVYFQGHSFREPSDLCLQQYNHIFSLDENKAARICNTVETKALFEDHNMNYMSRVYPRGTRFSSSNFDPNTFWRRGVQMVALNWQTYDAHMQMNQAMFAAGCDQYGYVLKPEYLRKPRGRTGDFEYRVKLPRYEVSFSVKIISAQQLPRLSRMAKTEAINPFIEVQMFSAEDRARGIATGTGGHQSSAVNGYHGIGSPYSRRTQIVHGNGYSPQFNDTMELSLETKYPELVFVRFMVFNSPIGKYTDKSNNQLAVFTAKLDSLQQGYRHLPLYNGYGEEFIFSTLLCQITKKTPNFMPSSLQDLADRTARPRLFRSMLTRTMSSERGRDRVSSLEEQQTARQRKLNREIEECVTRK